MFVDEFLPFIMSIIHQYYQTTANSSNSQHKVISLASLSLLDAQPKEAVPDQMMNFQSTQAIDDKILQNSLDLL